MPRGCLVLLSTGRAALMKSGPFSKNSIPILETMESFEKPLSSSILNSFFQMPSIFGPLYKFSSVQFKAFARQRHKGGGPVGDEDFLFIKHPGLGITDGIAGPEAESFGNQLSAGNRLKIIQ